MAKLKKDLTNLAKSVKKKKDEDIAPVGGKSTRTTAPFKKAAQMMDNVKSSDRFQEQKRRNAENAALEKRAKEIESELLTRPEYAQTAHDMRELDLIAKHILHATDVMETAEKVKKTTEKAIAPFKSVLEGMKDTEWLSNAELLDDGYQPWKFELWRTANASMADAVEHLQQGGVDFAEGAIDSGATFLGDLAGKVGWTDAQDFLMNDVVFHDVVKKPWEYVEDGLGIDIPSVHEILGISDEDIENRSILGEGLEGSTESLAQMMLTKEIAKGANIPWQAVTGVTTYGQGVSEGMEQGLDNEQAKKLGFINAVAEIATESLFGDSVMGEKGLFDLGKLTSEITIPLLKLAADYGLTIPSNAIEEGLTEAINIAGEAHVRGEDVRAALTSEEGLKRIGNSMFSGAVFSAITNAPNAVKAGATGTDFKTGLTKNETEIVDRVTDKLASEKESNGEKITDTKRGKIRQSVVEMMDRGEISTDLIEEVFGGETYKKLQDITESEKKIIEKLSQQYSGEELKQKVDSILSGSERNAIKDQLSNEVSKFVQNDRLSESYRQNAEGKVKFNADLSQYNDAERKIVKKAIESGVLNNKRKTHELVDFVAKVAAKLGVDFDFVNNEKLKELGFSVDGADINGYVDKNGNIVLNAESSKYLNVVLGHEISHVLEGTELYEAVEKILVDFSVNKKAKNSKFKNEYQERLDRAISLYQNLEGYKGVEGFKNIEREVFADLIGDYLFTDKSFVEHLANTSHKGFQKILDSIESLYKMATAGSKEAKALEKLKQTFMDAFAEAEGKRTTTKADGNIKYSLATSEDGVASNQNLWYNENRGDSYARTNEFRKLQEESARMSGAELQGYHRGDRALDESLRDRLSRVLTEQVGAVCGGSGDDSRLLKLGKDGNSYEIYEDVNGELFHDAFEISRQFLLNGELVDLHTVETTKDGIGYNDCYNYLSKDGLSGFSITPTGDLISVFNASGKKGFLRAISDVVKSKAKTLDCYASPNQNLMAMYEKVFGFKTASVMEYNMEYDHDDIAKNHFMPNVAFMVNTSDDVETRFFGKDDYDAAVEYRDSFVTEDSEPKYLKDLSIDDINAMFDEIGSMTDAEIEEAYKLLGLDKYLDLDDDILLEDDFSVDDISEETSVKPEIIEILYRRSGLGNTHIADGKKAVMTEDRINQRIREHSAKFSPDYARAYITRISPKDFIDLTVFERNVDREQFDANVRGDLDSTMGDWDYEQQLKNSEEPPRLLVDITTGKIIGHNGRHRVRALEKSGIESVEIEVEFYDEYGMVKENAHTIPDMAISSQFDTAIETRLANIIPFNSAHKAEIEQYYGENANADAKVKYSLSNGSENTYGDYRISGEDVSFKDIAPAKTTQETVRTEQNVPMEENPAIPKGGYLDNLIKDSEKFIDVDVTIPKETPGIAPSANSLPNLTPEQLANVAQIKRYDPKKKDGGFFARTKKIFNEFVTAFGDKAWALENLSKKIGDDKVEADYDFMAHRSQGVAQQYIKKNLIPFIKKLEQISKSANNTPVVEVTKAGNKTVTDYFDKFNYYAQHLNNIDRMSRETAEERSERLELRDKLKGMSESQIEDLARERITEDTPKSHKKKIRAARKYLEMGGRYGKNVPVFNNDFITADVSRQMVKIYEQAHPEFKSLVKEYQQYFRNLRDWAEQENLTSQDTIKLWDKISPNYIPVSRTDKNGNHVSVPLDSKKTGVNNPFKRAKGGNSDIEPFAETAAKYTNALIYNLYRNKFGITLKDAMDKSTAIDAQKSMDKETLKKIMDGALEPGTRVKAADRDNVGTIKSFDAKSGKYMVYFENKQGHSATVPLDGKILTPLNPIHERGKTDANDLLDSTEVDDNKVLTPGENGKAPQFTVYIKGKPVTFDITEEIYNALKPTEGILSQTYFTAKHLERFKKLQTELKPTFAFFRNPFKDAKDVLFNSKHAAKTYMNVPEAFKQILQNGKWNQEFDENGGDTITYYKSDTHELDIRADEKGKWKLYSKAAQKIEKLFRLAEYIASRKSGRDVQQSMLDAARVTTNFQAGGDVTKWANRNFSPFLNPSVQGGMQAVRNVREAYHGGAKNMAVLAAKVIAVGIAPVAALMNFLIWDDDEDYQALSDYVKANYFILAKVNGKFIRLPKGRTEAVLQYAGKMMEDLITGDDETDLETFAQLVANNIAPNNPIEDTLWAPIVQAFNNETWYGEDLVPTRLQDLPAEEQYDESTDYLSKFIGETFGISPYKFNYVLDQYGGGVSDMVLPFLTPQAEGENFLAPLVDEFVSDPVFKNQYVSDFYDIKDKLNTNAKSTKATDDDILMNKYMSSVSDEMSDLYAEKRRIQNSDMSDSEKYKKIREIQKDIDALAEDALNSYEGINYEGNYAEIGGKYYKWDDKDETWEKLSAEQTTKYLLTKEAKGHYVTDGKVHYRLDEDGNWTKISDKQLARQKEVTKSLGITPDEYWSKTSISYMPMSNGEYEYAFENPNTYTVAKAVGGYEAYSTYSKGLSGIKADKDSNGKSISGSRKKKVVSYISSLDIEDGEKYILYKKEYPSDDTYNYEIVEYLNSRKDISYKEMETILKELGFKVDSKGNISW